MKKIGDGLPQKIRLRHEISIEDGEELPLCLFQPILKSFRLEAVTTIAMY